MRVVHGRTVANGLKEAMAELEPVGVAYTATAGGADQAGCPILIMPPSAAASGASLLAHAAAHQPS